MENPEEEAVYLRMDCRDICPKKLEKGFKKIKGVSKVFIDQKKDMVLLVTKIDPISIVEIIKQMGLTAKIINPFDKSKTSSKKGRSNGHHKMKHHHDYTSESYDEDDDNSGGCNAGRHDHHIRERKHHRHRCSGGGKKMKEKEHVCENFEIPHIDRIGQKIDEHVLEAYNKPGTNPQVCRDFYCKLHNQRGTITCKVPSIDSEDHPCHTNGYRNGLGMEGGSIFEESVPFEYFPQRMPPLPPGYDSYPTSIMPGNHDYGYSGMPMPLSGYDHYDQYAYSRQGMPLPGYDHHGYGYPTGRLMPRYDEHAFTRNNMAFDGRG